MEFVLIYECTCIASSCPFPGLQYLVYWSQAKLGCRFLLCPASDLILHYRSWDIVDAIVTDANLFSVELLCRFVCMYSSKLGAFVKDIVP